MKKLLLVSSIVSLITGCAQTSIDSNLLQIEGVSLKEIGSGQSVIDTYTVIENTHSNIENIKICLASSIGNSGVTLNDSVGSYVGAYSGHYYQKSNATTVQGTNTILAETKDRVVATGVGEYYTDGIIPIQRYVRYIVTVSPTTSKTKYVFTKIEQAAKNTGSVANNGFSSAGAWSGADPTKVINTLDNEVKKVTKCLTN